jgi:hypothetical protein
MPQGLQPTHEKLAARRMQANSVGRRRSGVRATDMPLPMVGLRHFGGSKLRNQRNLIPRFSDFRQARGFCPCKITRSANRGKPWRALLGLGPQRRTAPLQHGTSIVDLARRTETFSRGLRRVRRNGRKTSRPVDPRR